MKNMKKQKETEILPDKPLDNPELDRFGYREFSENLAKSILAVSSNQGFVIALYGQWGSGKTTITNFVSYYLKKEPVSKRPIIIKFNPWWFSGDENLIRHFFQQLRISIEQETVDGEELDKELNKDLLLFMDVVSEVATGLEFPWWVKGGVNIGKKIAGQPTSLPALPTIKESIAKKLLKSKRKILVIIDDIDRLTAEEIRQIFKLVKAVGDFPNVIYLLSFDKKVAIESLKKVQNIPGEEYLEKIVQAPFEVPMPDRYQLNTLFVERINALIEEEEDKRYDEQHWQNIFFGGLENYLTTPRKIIQLYNALSVTYPAVKGEVNNIDFMAIEAIRVFTPQVYDVMRQNSKMFARDLYSSSSRNDAEEKELKEFHDGWLTALPSKDRDILKKIMPVLFPKLQQVLSGHHLETANETELRLLNRICHPDVFPIYFRFGVSSDTVSTLEIKTIVKLTSDKKLFAKRLLQLSKQKLSTGKTRLSAVLDRLRDYSENKIPTENIQNVIDIFFDIGDNLLIESDKNDGELFGGGNDLAIGRIIWALLKRNNKETNFAILKQAIENGNAISVMTREIAILGQQHGKNGGNQDSDREKHLTLEKLEELEKLVAKKIEKAAKKGTLLKTPLFKNILFRWKDWSGENKVQTWIAKTVEDDNKFISFIESFLFFSTSYSGRGKRVTPRLDPEWFKSFLNIEQNIDRIKILSKGKRLTEKQKIAFNQFLKEHDMRQNGKNPDGFFAFDEE